MKGTKMKNKIKKPKYNLFDEVWFIGQQWSSKKQKCGFCGGEGEIGIEPIDNSLPSEIITCPKCDGDGLINESILSPIQLIITGIRILDFCVTESKYSYMYILYENEKYFQEIAEEELFPTKEACQKYIKNMKSKKK